VLLWQSSNPDFSFISLISESEADVELHPKLKLTNTLKYKQRFLKIHSRQCYCIYLFVYLFIKLPVSWYFLTIGCCRWFHYITSMFSQVHCL